jgi:hypothetical protein
MSTSKGMEPGRRNRSWTISIFVATMSALLPVLGLAVLKPGSDIAPGKNRGHYRVAKDRRRADRERMVIPHPDPKGIVLLLHGFPETLFAWIGVGATLGRDYIVGDFAPFDRPKYMYPASSPKGWYINGASPYTAE